MSGGLMSYGASLAILHPWPNIPVERTVHSAGFVVVPELGGCGPQLTESVRPPPLLNNSPSDL
jgi:hypothetical protein